MLYACIILGILILWFLFILHHERRSLISGFSLLCVLVWYLVCIGLFYLWVSDNYIPQYKTLQVILNISALLVIILILIFPILFILTYFIQGIRLIRKEGFHFSNTLSLLLSILLVLYLLIYSKSEVLHQNIWIKMLATILSLSVTYLLLEFTIYCFTSIINLIHFNKKKPIDYIIVLGCGIFNDKITPLLAARVDKGLRILAHHPEAKIIFSGGQGKGETIAEAECMYRYALDKGIDVSKMIKEDRSMNTEENLKNSMEFIQDHNADIVIVTTRYHVLRALLMARNLNMKCIGYGSDTKSYFSLNATLREFVGYISITKKRHIIALILFILFELSITLFTYFHTL